MQALQHPIDIVPLIMMGAATLFFIVAIIILFPYLQRERHADDVETRALHAAAEAAQAADDHGHLH